MRLSNNWQLNNLLRCPKILDHYRDIQLYFGYWNTMKNADVGPEQDQLKNCFAEEIQKLFGVEFTDKQMVGFPTIKAAQWIPKLDLLIEIVKRAVG